MNILLMNSKIITENGKLIIIIIFKRKMDKYYFHILYSNLCILYILFNCYTLTVF